MINLEINKELVLSTAHITPSTNKFLKDNYNTLNYSCDDNAIRLLSDCFEGELDEYTEFSELYYLLALAKSHNCKWLVLDCDGLKVKELPVYHWE